LTETAVPPVRPRPRSVSIEIAAHLERLIAMGGLEPGARLPAERELAAQMHVSRTSLREAMHELERKRLIERRPGFGTVVVMPTAEQEALQDLGGSEELGLEIDDVMELREVLEPRVAAYAAQRATEANLLQLREVIDQWTGDLTAAQYARLDAEFHLLLSQSSQNPLFKTLGGLSAEWSSELRSGSRSPNTARSRAESAAEHRAIFEAVAAHDPERADRAMRDHLSAVTARLQRAPGRRGASG
jgi:GntR family transcriptional repressor for pyruvate dehydrogenase complex